MIVQIPRTILLIVSTSLALVALALSALAMEPDTSDLVVEESNLGTPPAILSRPALMLPGIADIAHVEGKVRIRVLVGKDGKPIKTHIVHRVPEFAFIFDDEARLFAMNIQFSPALDSGGNAVNAWVTIPLDFQLDDFEPPVTLETGVSEYPERAKALGIEGWVGVAVVVDDMGFVSKDVNPVIIAREFPEETIFDHAAIDAARKSRFTPGRSKLGNEKSWAFVKITFTIPE
ncbi:MAG: TonB family protein [Ignavibacteriae bacterium]|nr:TonB family protein [Ignavibacteriota bacterium]